jgi:hypothetical protein
VTRVVAEAAGRVDRLDGLRRIGIDEIAIRKGGRCANHWGLACLRVVTSLCTRLGV